jgi:hypothetical protein
MRHPPFLSLADRFSSLKFLIIWVSLKVAREGKSS